MLLHLTNACFFFIYLFFLMSLIANALKASRCVQIHAIEFSLLAIRLCRIRRALLMPCYERSAKTKIVNKIIKRIILRIQ